MRKPGLTLNSRFSALKSKDGKRVITDEGKSFLFKKFIHRFPNFPIGLLWDVDSFDVFFWCQFEEMNPSLKNVLETMEELARTFLSEMGGDIRVYFSHKKRNA